jgi:hypothetical protein
VVSGGAHSTRRAKRRLTTSVTDSLTVFVPSPEWSRRRSTRSTHVVFHFRGFLLFLFLFFLLVFSLSLSFLLLSVFTAVGRWRSS